MKTAEKSFKAKCCFGISESFSLSASFLLASVKFLFFALLFFSQQAYAQTLDTTAVSPADSIAESVQIADTNILKRISDLSNSVSVFISANGKSSANDFQQLKNQETNVWVFGWIFFALLFLSLFRNLFRNESSEFFDQVVNMSGASVLGRSYQFSFSAFSFLMIVVFVVNASIISAVFTKYFLVHCNSELEFLTLIFVFLFTLFIVFKFVTVSSVGFVFDEKSAAAEYLRDFFVIIQTIGISMFPLVAFVVIASNEFLLPMFYITVVLLFVFVFVFAIRGLSTSVNLLYKSLYHFLLYICVQEILSVFLFIKLLTKIAF